MKNPTRSATLATLLIASAACSQVEHESKSTTRALTREAPVRSLQDAQEREYEKPRDRPAPMTGKGAHYYYDGQVKRSVWANPELIVEFRPTPERKNALLSTGYVASDEAVEGAGVRVWRLSPGAEPDFVARSSNQSLDAEAFSPVFHDGNAPGAPKRALPGGVIVTLDEQWSDEQVESFLAVNGLGVRRRLDIGRHVLVLDSAAGMASLELANRLHESGEVVSATPDWWREAATR